MVELNLQPLFGRVGGKKRFGQSNYESGVEIRAQVVETDSTMAAACETNPLCPFENLFEEAPLLAELIKEIGEENALVYNLVLEFRRIKPKRRTTSERDSERGVQRLSNQV